MLAQLMLIALPVIAPLVLRSFPRNEAIFASMLAVYLLTPSATAIPIPLLPDIDKTMSAMLAMLFVIYLKREPAWKRRKNRLEPGTLHPLKGWILLHPVGLGLILMLLFSSFMTGYVNGQPLTYGPLFIPGMDLRETMSFVMSSVVVVAPLLIGRRYLGDPKQHERLLLLLVGAALIYSLPSLVESLKGPVFHARIYGFFQHIYVQHIRGGSFRPIVFLEHGLRLGVFMGMAFLGSLILFRMNTGKKRTRYMMIAGYLFLVLLLARCLGAFAMAVVMGPLFLLAGRRVLNLTVLAFSLTLLIYPVLRAADVLPLQAIVTWAEGIDAERARSLKGRLLNEDMALNRAAEQPLFGWGTWGRDRVYTDAGRDMTVSDGIWTIIFGQRGWLGYIEFYGLLVMPMVLIILRQGLRNIPLATTGMMLIMIYNLIDMIPNSSLTVLTWTLAGSFWGYLELQRKPRRSRKRMSALFKGPAPESAAEASDPPPDPFGLGGAVRPFSRPGPG